MASSPPGMDPRRSLLQRQFRRAALEPRRRQGIARRLVTAAFEASGAQRLDLLTDDAHDFYRSFDSKEKSGFRIYPR